jgi:hypothetical protein
VARLGLAGVIVTPAVFFEPAASHLPASPLPRNEGLLGQTPSTGINLAGVPAQRVVAVVWLSPVVAGVDDSDLDPSGEPCGRMGVAGGMSDFLFKSMTVEENVRSLERSARPNEVSIKITAAPMVTLLRNVPGPRLPKTVWLDPPNAAPISAPLPACNKIEAIIRKQTIT